MRISVFCFFLLCCSRDTQLKSKQNSLLFLIIDEILNDNWLDWMTAALCLEQFKAVGVLDGELERLKTADHP